MAAQGAFRQFDLLQTQRGQAFLHCHLPWHQATNSMCLPAKVDQRIEQRHHAAAFGEQRLAGVDVGRQRGPQPMIIGQCFGMQFGVAAG